jgi:hypothetical protein
MINDDNEYQEYIPEDEEDGSKWIKLSFGELLETVTLLNSIIDGKETEFTPEAIVKIAVHNYKIADSLYSTIKYLFDSFANVEERITTYMVANYPEEWKEYDKIIDEYDEVQDSVAQAVNHYKDLNKAEEKVNDPDA